MCTYPDVVRILGDNTCNLWRNTWILFLEFLSNKRCFPRGWVVQEVTLQSLEEKGDTVILFGSYYAS